MFRPEDLEFYNLIGRGREWLEKVIHVFEDEKHAKEELGRLKLLSESNIEKLDNGQIIQSIIPEPCLLINVLYYRHAPKPTLPFYYFPLTSLPSLFVTGVLGYMVDLDVGITSGILGNQDLLNRLRMVWENAVKELHPFQRGPTHQGTKHCRKILQNLDSLTSVCAGSLLKLEEGTMMSIAAAIHDVMKGDLLATNAGGTHATDCANLISNHPDIFKLDGMDVSCVNLIKTIVAMHNPEGQSSPINVLGNFKIEDSNLGIKNPSVKVDNLCALFHLVPTCIN